MVDIVDKALRMGEGRQLKRLENVAKAVNALEDQISALSDEELKGQTAKFKQKLDNGAKLDDLMPEAFATVREVSKRTLVSVTLMFSLWAVQHCIGAILQK